MTEMVHRSMSMSEPKRMRSGWFSTIDRGILVAILILFVIGLLLSMASTPTLAERLGRGQFYFVIRQLIYGGLALVVMFVLSTFSVTMVRRLGVLGFMGAFMLLLMLPAIGSDFGKGAVRWLSLGFITIQPSEFLKPGFAIIIAWFVAASKVAGGPPGRVLATGLTGFLVIWLALQPDFGQATLILMCFLAVMFVSGFNWIWIASILGVVAFGAQLSYNTSSHVAGRIDSFLAQELDPQSQIGIAANAISNGGLFGAGVGEGTVKNHLPDAHTDFIMAVAAEEYGLFLCLIIMALFAFIVVRSFLILMRTSDIFARLAGVGLVTLFGAQSMINLGVAARLFPTKGMTLPLISYGGSSMLAMGITLGFLLALTRRGHMTRMSGTLQ